ADAARREQAGPPRYPELQVPAASAAGPRSVRRGREGGDRSRRLRGRFRPGLRLRYGRDAADPDRGARAAQLTRTAPTPIPGGLPPGMSGVTRPKRLERGVGAADGGLA